MQREPPNQRDINEWGFMCVGISVVLGIVVGQVFDFENSDKMHLVSLTGRGPVADLLLIAATILMVVVGARIAVTLRPGRLMFLGVVLLVVAFASPTIVARISSGKRVSIAFLPLAGLEFVGAALAGAGLRQLIWRDRTKPQSTEEGRKAE
jgi:hypothetical protein